jgi:hypothetical protein
VTARRLNDETAIVIQPADPQIIYPPAYDPSSIWETLDSNVPSQL